MDHRKVDSLHKILVACVLYVCVAKSACCSARHAGRNLFCRLLSEQPREAAWHQWWKEVEARMLGMGSNINPLMFTKMHIQRVAPTIFGAPAWSILTGEHFMDWTAFCEAVDHRYVLSRRAWLRAFFDMQPEPEESTAKFLCHMEDMQARYQVGKKET